MITFKTVLSLVDWVYEWSPSYYLDHLVSLSAFCEDFESFEAAHYSALEAASLEWGVVAGNHAEVDETMWSYQVGGTLVNLHRDGTGEVKFLYWDTFQRFIKSHLVMEPGGVVGVAEALPDHTHGRLVHLVDWLERELGLEVLDGDLPWLYGDRSDHRSVWREMPECENLYHQSSPEPWVLSGPYMTHFVTEWVYNSVTHTGRREVGIPIRPGRETKSHWRASRRDSKRQPEARRRAKARRAFYKLADNQ